MKRREFVTLFGGVRLFDIGRLGLSYHRVVVIDWPMNLATSPWRYSAQYRQRGDHSPLK